MIDVDSPPARVLRALQQFDQIAFRRADILLRPLIIQAETELGGLLGLQCTGEDEGGGHYDHAGETCPIHEWLVPDDEAEAEAYYAKLPPKGRRT